MNESTPSTPLTDQAMARLKKLAESNGAAADHLELLGSEEKTFLIEGTLSLTPKCEAQPGHYAGPVRSKKREIFQNVGEMRTEVAKRREEFQKGRGWLDACIKELDAAEAGGWGLDGAHISLPGQSAILAASDTCPTCSGRQLLTCQQCGGQGLIICPQCQGRQYEVCPTCGGAGSNPLQPDQRCVTCNGNRQAPCRYCQGRGQLTCPTCHGKRGTACNACNGSGVMTEEVALSCGAETLFKIKGEGLPSGLRRGLDRLGIANLTKGHADIEIVAPQGHEKEVSGEDIEAQRVKGPVEARNFHAKLPYADLRMNFGGKKAIVSAFGKRCSLLGVPSFLDDALEPAFDLLKRAARGTAPLEDALSPRAMRETLALVVGGKAHINELRRHYPVGLSSEAMKSMLANMRLAINRFTLKIRTAVAVACVALSAAIFAGIFLTPLHAELTAGFSSRAIMGVNIALVLIVMAMSWFALSSSIRIVLQKRFTNVPIAKQQKIGKTGYAMLGGIAASYMIIMWIAQMVG